VALCQFLPGPASTQVSISIGIIRAGLPGGFAAWLGFTLPSALALVAFAYVLQGVDITDAGWLHGLKVAAVAVVANAVWGMARSLTPDRERMTIAVVGAAVVLLWQSVLSQVLVIAGAGIIGWRLLPHAALPSGLHLRAPIPRWLAIAAWVVFFGLLVALPVARQGIESQALALFDSFYRAGSLVFGGGHVVLPLLHAEVVPQGWVTEEEFVAGYGAAQAVPGPLFTFAGYLGAVMQPEPSGWQGALITLTAIFLPSFLLIIGALPFWDFLRTRDSFRSALLGINAGVVGILIAALYQPVWTSAIDRAEDFALALAAFLLLAFWRTPPWLVVILAALGGAAIDASI
jgi:chromate transporter